MSYLPQKFLDSLNGIEGFDKKAFEKVHSANAQVTSIRMNPAKWTIDKEQLAIENSIDQSTLPISQKVPWAESGYYLKERPSFTFDPLFHAGCYYVQEASSMFLEEAIKQTVDLSKPLMVLDLCAAPGGKSTHLQSLISPDSILVSNEVIKTRSLALTDNIIKWGCKNVVVTNNDPLAFQKLPGYFDVIVVDAPCSGSGLFRKDEEAITEWSLNNVQLCCQRQQRILADALPALKDGGILIYSTCSYSKEEDEEIAEWLVKELKMENIKLRIPESWNIVETHAPKLNVSGYRFFPDKLNGEGFFMACFRKNVPSEKVRFRPPHMSPVSSKEKQIVSSWINETDFSLFKFRDEIIGVPASIFPHVLNLFSSLNVQYAGVHLGSIMKEKLVPHHALALSLVISSNVPDTNLEYENAIRYLQRADVTIKPEKIGWQTVSYQNFRLGWINALKNRINNYYPKEIRILKQHNNAH